MDNSTRKAVGLAFEAGYGDRLVEIAQEHIRLATLASQHKSDRNYVEILSARIKALRKERDSIIAQYEEVGADASS